MQLDLDPRAWLRKAERDLAMADAGERLGLYEESIYHFHQACEKLFKGLLVQFTGSYPKLHDLRGLLEMCAMHDPVLRNHDSDAKKLGGLNAATRYPLSPDLTLSEFAALKTSALSLSSALSAELARKLPKP